MESTFCSTPEELIRLMRGDPGLAAYKARRLEEYVVEARSSAASVLLVWPGLWKDGESLHTLLQHYAHEACQTVLLGKGSDFDELAVDAARVRLFCWALPMGASRLRTNLKTLFGDLVERHLAADQRSLVARYRYELDELVSIAKSLSSQQDFDRLLEVILEKSRYVTGADAGSVYVLEEGEDGKPRLRFKITQNDSVKTDFREFSVEVSERSVVGNAVLGATSINIPDLYSEDEDNFWSAHHDRSFDRRMGYESHSMLTVPMINRRSDVIGVIQIINRKRDPGTRLNTPEDFKKQVIPFDERSEELALSLAALAGIALENAMLYREVKNLFEGLVEASVAAIESRDPTTSGHSKRVAELTCSLAEAVNACDSGSLASVEFTKEQIMEMKYSGLLHDFGKVGVREHVLVKAHKLYPEEMAVVKWRFEAMARALEAEKFESCVDFLKKAFFETGGENESAYNEVVLGLEKVGAEFDARRKTLERFLEIVIEANRPSFLKEDTARGLMEMAGESYLDTRGETHPMLTGNELESLNIQRGSLTQKEREEIESHVRHTQNFLGRIPWGKSLARVPEIASKHHEKIDGSGYPDGVDEDGIPIESKMMAIADIYDALTASDRPYKKAMDVDRALAIIKAETEAGKYDPELYRLFVESKVYRLGGESK